MTESGYLLKWFNVNYWRTKYFNRIKNALKLKDRDQLWTFDIIQFPYAIHNTILRQPESDYSNRPKNLKPRISVLFAYNASGDYLQPFFVYPLNFYDENDKDESNPNEYYSQNGFISPQVFDHWLHKCFLPYVKQQQQQKTTTEHMKMNILMLFCAKLSLIDKQTYFNFKKEQKNDQHISLSFFTCPFETFIPFNLLFKENLRKRQVDLFLDSWRKCTCRLGLSYQFKCVSKQQFFNIFMDTFQMCIEEIGNNQNISSLNKMNNSPNTKSMNNSSVQHFSQKMINTFEQCKLWPLHNEDYEEFFTNLSINHSTDASKKSSSDYFMQDAEDTEQEQSMMMVDQEGEEEEDVESDDEDYEESVEPASKRARTTTTTTTKKTQQRTKKQQHQNLADYINTNKNQIYDMIKTEIKENLPPPASTVVSKAKQKEVSFKLSKEDKLMSLVKDLVHCCLTINNSNKSQVGGKNNGFLSSEKENNYQKVFDTIAEKSASNLQLVQELMSRFAKKSTNNNNNYTNNNEQAREIAVDKLSDLLCNHYTK
jgi:hypothetical protein